MRMTSRAKCLGALAAALVCGVAPAQAGNIADCDAIVMKLEEDGSAGGAGLVDAGAVIASILDPDSPTIMMVDGFRVAGLACTRRDPVPDTEDYPLIASGIPLILSRDFDSDDAPTVTIALDADRRAVPMLAVGLSDVDKARLEAVLEAYEPQAPTFTMEDVEAESVEADATRVDGDGTDDTRDE